MNINEKKSFDVIVIGGGAAGMMAPSQPRPTGRTR